MPKFGDLGVEGGPGSPHRIVMFVAPEKIVILSSTYPGDLTQPHPVIPGNVTYEIKETDWDSWKALEVAMNGGKALDMGKA